MAWWWGHWWPSWLPCSQHHSQFWELSYWESFAQRCEGRWGCKRRGFSASEREGPNAGAELNAGVQQVQGRNSVQGWEAGEAQGERHSPGRDQRGTMVQEPSGNTGRSGMAALNGAGGGTKDRGAPWWQCQSRAGSGSSPVEGLEQEQRESVT